MKTTNIPMYGNVAVYIKYCIVSLNIDAYNKRVQFLHN